MKILVLGVVGMLGNTVFRLLGQSTEIEVVGTARSTDVAQFFDRRIAGNLEIAIVNDGSADGGETEAIALERVRQHPDKVKYRAKRNGGVASALNCALEIATGDYFAWLSHDDIHLPHKTAAQIDYFAEIGMSDVCLFSNYALIDPEGRRLATTRHSVSDFVDHPRKAFPTGALNGCTLLIPMWIMRKYAPFDESLR